MKRVFADAFFYIAALNRNDAAHRQAVAFMAGSPVELITTTAVLMEVGDAMSALNRRQVCGEFLADLVQQPAVKVRDVDHEMLGRGLALYRARLDKAWSLTDCISFVVMKDEGLMEALTGDHHFMQAGFTMLLTT